jgi:hypothetical protein
MCSVSLPEEHEGVRFAVAGGIEFRQPFRLQWCYDKVRLYVLTVLCQRPCRRWMLFSVSKHIGSRQPRDTVTVFGFSSLSA